MIFLHPVKQLITIWCLLFLAMQYLKDIRTDDSSIENSDIETKHLISGNHFLDQNQMQLEITYTTRHTHST